MNKFIIILTIFVGSLNAQGLYLDNYRFENGGVEYYAIPYTNAQVIDYWARKGIFSEPLIADMSKSIDFHQMNSNAIFEKLKDCIELSQSGMKVATNSTQAASEWQLKYDIQNREYMQYRKAVKTGLLFGGGFIGVLILSLALQK